MLRLLRSRLDDPAGTGRSIQRHVSSDAVAVGVLDVMALALHQPAGSRRQAIFRRPRGV